MLSNIIRDLPCPNCGEGTLYYDQKTTMEVWQHPNIFRLDDVDKLKDGMISDILVMSCDKCDSNNRYTLKEIDKIFRKKLTNTLLTKIAMGDLPDPGSMLHSSRLFYYCGKCSGFDGKGTCPKDVYNGCELKRLPYGF